jgi:hypothetical protein
LNEIYNCGNMSKLSGSLAAENIYILSLKARFELSGNIQFHNRDNEREGNKIQ